MKTVLVAESHLPTLRRVTEILGEAGFQVLTATEPGAALEHFAVACPDAVLVAVDLAPLEGVLLSVRIRQSLQGARVPILVLDRAHLGAALGVSAILDFKANALIADPTVPAELVPRLRSLVVAVERTAVEAPIRGRIALSRPPLATGELSDAGLPGLLVTLAREKKSGVLVVLHGGSQQRVFLLDGEISDFESNQLGEEGGGADLGGRSARVMGGKVGRFAFYEGEDFRPESQGPRVPLLEAMLVGVRKSYPLRTFAQSLQAHFDEFPARTESFAADLPLLRFGNADLKFAMQINGRIRLRHLLAHGRGDIRTTTSLAWLLSLSGALRFAMTPQGDVLEGEDVQAERIFPRRRKPLPPEIVTGLRDAAVKIVTGSYFQVLGLPITAGILEVESAYQETAAKFHPDSYTDHDTSELQDLLEVVQDKLAAAHRVLISDERRLAYLEHLLPRLATSRVGPPNVEAEIALRRGDDALLRRDGRSARVEYETAIRLNPKEPEYYPRHAWATFVGLDGDRAERARAASKALKRAFTLDPNLERAQVCAAIFENASGQPKEARRRLLQVLQRNPDSKLAKAALRRVGR